MSDSPAPVPREIVGFRREDAHAVVLSLGCGHDRHVRHRPPLQPCPWVTDDEACRARIGGSIECFACGQRRLPEGVEPYRRTASFDEHSVPAGLLADHTTRAGVWGRLWVEQGSLTVEFAPPLSEEARADPSTPVVIPPQLRHHVRLAGPVRFHVEFLRIPVEPG